MTSLVVLRGKSIKEGDTMPSLRMKCLTELGDAFNLSGYDVTFRMTRSNDDSPTVDATATVEQADVGVVEYSWSAGETNESGTYLIELVADDGAGSTITFPNDGYARLYIENSI